MLHWSTQMIMYKIKNRAWGKNVLLGNAALNNIHNRIKIQHVPRLRRECQDCDMSLRCGLVSQCFLCFVQVSW